MNKIQDYLDWRGDLSFREAPMNEIDRYVIACIGKPDFTGFIPAGRKSVTVAEAVNAFFEANPEIGDKLGVIGSQYTLPILRRIATMKRYKDLKLSAFINKIDTEATLQFSALTVKVPGYGYFVTFRGTDDTIVAWKENFYLAAKDIVPAQQDALDYLTLATKLHPFAKLTVMGHSKGGNLAQYAAIKASPRIQKRIQLAISFDGPGFSDEFLAEEGIQRLQGKLLTYSPEKAVVSMLLNPVGERQVIFTDKVGVLGHDGFTWCIDKENFTRADKLSDFSLRVEKLINDTMHNTAPEERQQFIDAFFDALSANGASTLTEVSESNLGEIFTMFRSFGKEKETRSFLWDMIKTGVKNLFEGNKGSEPKGE